MAFGTRAYPKPGRSTNLNLLLIRKKFNDCVRPGVEEVRARPRTESRELIKLDFPTFERPMNAISGNCSTGQSAAWKLLFRNSALVIFILLPKLGAQTSGSASTFVEPSGKQDACAPSPGSFLSSRWSRIGI